MHDSSNNTRSESPGARRLVVLFVVPSLGRAGAERQLVDLVNRLPDDRFEKHLLCYRPDTSLLDVLDTDKVAFHHERRSRKFDFSLARRIARLIDDLGVDIVHCTLQNALLYGGLAVRLSRSRHARLIAALHTTINVNLKHELADRLLYRFFLKRCDEVWFVCRAQEQHWIRRFSFLKSKSHVIHNGVDSGQFSPQTKRAELIAGLPSDAIVISCVAGFRPEKGHDILVRAFRSIVDSNRRAKLVLAGDGPTRPAAESLVSELGLEESVLFTGQIGDVKPLVAASTVTVLASTAVETFSIAMLESMSMAVPVVATDIGGAAEAIEDGRNGYLVEPGDERGLASALQRLVDDENHAHRLGLEARSTVTRLFDTAIMVDAAAKRLDA